MIDNQQSLKTKIKFASHPDWKPRKHFSCTTTLWTSTPTVSTSTLLGTPWEQTVIRHRSECCSYPKASPVQGLSTPLLLLDPALMYQCTNSSEILCVEAQMPPTIYLCFNGLTSQGTWKPLGGKKKSLEVPLCLLRSQKSPALLPANPQTSPCALLTSLWLDIPNCPSLKLCSFENRMALQGFTAGVPLPLQVS